MLRWLKTNHQALTAVGAMVVGLAALFIAWDQARVMRAQQHGAVVPALQIDPFISGADNNFSAGVRINNNGVGPAFIESVAAFRDGEPQPTLNGLVDGLPEQTVDRSWSTMAGRVIAPGEQVTPLRLAWSTEVFGSNEAATLVAEWEHWDLQVCYCSVFDRCWISGLRSLRDEPVDRCPVQDTDIFEAFGLLPMERTEAP